MRRLWLPWLLFCALLLPPSARASEEGSAQQRSLERKKRTEAKKKPSGNPTEEKPRKVFTGKDGKTEHRTEPTLPPKEVASASGVRIEHYTKSGDHGPAHFHVIGGGAETKVGMNGKPVDGSPALTPAQQKVVTASLRKIRNAADKIQAYFRFQNDLPKGGKGADKRKKGSSK